MPFGSKLPAIRELIAAYQELGSISRVALKYGVRAAKVADVLTAARFAGLPVTKRPFTMSTGKPPPRAGKPARSDPFLDARATTGKSGVPFTPIVGRTYPGPHGLPCTVLDISGGWVSCRCGSGAIRFPEHDVAKWLSRNFPER